MENILQLLLIIKMQIRILAKILLLLNICENYAIL